MVNQSKVKDSRFWTKQLNAGAVSSNDMGEFTYQTMLTMAGGKPENVVNTAIDNLTNPNAIKAFYNGFVNNSPMNQFGKTYAETSADNILYRALTKRWIDSITSGDKEKDKNSKIWRKALGSDYNPYNFKPRRNLDEIFEEFGGLRNEFASVLIGSVCIGGYKGLQGIKPLEYISREEIIIPKTGINITPNNSYFERIGEAYKGIIDRK